MFISLQHSDRFIIMVVKTTPIATSAKVELAQPVTTRDKLIAVAAEVFNEVGYWGTDTNRLARAAGYAPATFYNHFSDKREIFLAAYRLLADKEWDEIRQVLADPETGGLDRVAEVILKHHRQRIGLRHSLRVLAVTDPDVRRQRREEQRRQLELMADLVEQALGARPTPERCFLAMLAVERTCDAIADGDADALDLSETVLLQELSAQLNDLAS